MTEREERPTSGAPVARARLTPYELVFGAGDFEQRIFPAIQQEADATALDPAVRESFSFLSTAGDALREMIPPDAPAEAIEQYRAILFHAFNFWRFAKRLYILEPAVVRYLVETEPHLAGWTIALPHHSLYLQLPPNLFWASISPQSTPEPIDGFFVTAAEVRDAQGRPFHRLNLLLILGIRRERVGFSVISFDTEVGPSISAEWLNAPGRENGRDFQNILPGGEISGLYSIVTSVEVLKLLARALWYVDQRAEDVKLEDAPELAASDDPAASRLSRLPYFRVTLGASERTLAEETDR